MSRGAHAGNRATDPWMRRDMLTAEFERPKLDGTRQWWTLAGLLAFVSALFVVGVMLSQPPSIAPVGPHGGIPSNVTLSQTFPTEAP